MNSTHLIARFLAKAKLRREFGSRFHHTNKSVYNFTQSAEAFELCAAELTLELEGKIAPPAGERWEEAEALAEKFSKIS